MSTAQHMSRHRHLTSKRLRHHLFLLALVLWTVAAIDIATPTRMMRTGQVKGTDFVHFYTLSRLAAEGRLHDFADQAAQRDLQLQAIPESADDWYPPVYGPQVALVLAPLGRLSYERALLAWVICTSLMYIAAVTVVGRRTRCLQSYSALVIAGSLAFPPFWNLIIHGQLSAL